MRVADFLGKGPPKSQLSAGGTLNAYKEDHSTRPVQGILNNAQVLRIITLHLSYNPWQKYLSFQYQQCPNQKTKKCHFGTIFNQMVEGHCGCQDEMHFRQSIFQPRSRTEIIRKIKLSILGGQICKLESRTLPPFLGAFTRLRI